MCMISEGTFKIFDFHSRDLYGIPDPFAKYVLIHAERLDNLSSVFQSINPTNTTTPFDVKGVKSSLLNTITEHDNHNMRQNQILDERGIKLEKRRQKYKERSETTEAREQRLTKLREMRKNQFSDKREKTLLDKCQRAKQNIISESSEASPTRLLRKREQTKLAVESETAEHREKRLLATYQKKRLAVSKETTEQKEKRLLARRQQRKQAIESETTEQREKKAISKTSTD